MTAPKRNLTISIGRRSRKEDLERRPNMPVLVRACI